MSAVLSIDPGIRGVGAALWNNGKLVVAEYVLNTEEKGSGPKETSAMGRAVWAWAGPRGFGAPGDTLVLEYPQTYGGRSSKGDANDLFPLAGVDASIATLYPGLAVVVYTPHEWKNDVPKPKKTTEEYIIATRLKNRFVESPAELAAIKLPTNVKLSWDVWDGVGVGMKFLGRFERQRAYARE